MASNSRIAFPIPTASATISKLSSDQDHQAQARVLERSRTASSKPMLEPTAISSRVAASSKPSRIVLPQITSSRTGQLNSSQRSTANRILTGSPNLASSVVPTVTKPMLTRLIPEASSRLATASSHLETVSRPAATEEVLLVRS